jgi:ribosomal protein S18 acetylase RimI-like enzyme
VTEMHHFDAGEATAILDRLVDVYLEVYADADPEFFSEDRYRRQLAGHMTAPGWELVTADVDGDMAGYIYGFDLPEGTRWWSGLLTDVPDGFTAETGQRTLAISELMVRPRWRRQGIARALHDELLVGRPEERATLLVETDNTAAQAAYASWGWQTVAQLRPSWEHAPLYDVLILPRLPA